MVRPVVAILLLWTLLALPASAEELSVIEAETDSAMKDALNNWHAEMVQCAAYYAYTQEAYNRWDDSEGEQNARKTFETLIMRAYALHRLETTDTHYWLALDAIGKEFYNDYTNFSIVLAKYGRLCKTVVENGDSRLQHWLGEASKN